MRAGYGAARVDGEGDREPPEKSRPQQTGQEARPACSSDRKGDKAIAEENQNECSQHFGQVLFSPAFGYCHYFLLLAVDQMSSDNACQMIPPLCAPPLANGYNKKVLTCTLQLERIGQDFSLQCPASRLHRVSYHTNVVVSIAHRGKRTFRRPAFG